MNGKKLYNLNENTLVDTYKMSKEDARDVMDDITKAKRENKNDPEMRTRINGVHFSFDRDHEESDLGEEAVIRRRIAALNEINPDGYSACITNKICTTRYSKFV